MQYIELQDEEIGPARAFRIEGPLPDFLRWLKGQDFTNVVILPPAGMKLETKHPERLDQIEEFARVVITTIAKIELESTTSFPQKGVWVGGTGIGLFCLVVNAGEPVPYPFRIKWTSIPGWRNRVPAEKVKFTDRIRGAASSMVTKTKTCASRAGSTVFHQGEKLWNKLHPEGGDPL